MLWTGFNYSLLFVLCMVFADVLVVVVTCCLFVFVMSLWFWLLIVVTRLLFGEGLGI